MRTERGFADSLADARRGIGSLLRSQPNARRHLVATLLTVGAGFGFGVSRLEWLALLLAIGLVWAAEALNTSIECLGDAISGDPDADIGRAKDLGAAAVLLASLAAAVTGGLIFLPRFLRLVS